MIFIRCRRKSAKPFDRKLAARAKVLAQFEKDWDKKLKSEAAARKKRKKAPAAKKNQSISEYN
jgi:hypothetical protein